MQFGRLPNTSDGRRQSPSFFVLTSEIGVFVICTGVSLDLCCSWPVRMLIVSTMCNNSCYYYNFGRNSYFDELRFSFRGSIQALL